MYFKWLFEEFCKVKMSDAVSLHLIFIFLPYALFPVQSNLRYLLVLAKQSWIIDVILRRNIVPPWLNLNSKCCFSISKFKTQLKMTLSRQIYREYLQHQWFFKINIQIKSWKFFQRSRWKLYWIKKCLQGET